MVEFKIDSDGDLQIIPSLEFNVENFGYLRDMTTEQALADIFECYTTNGWEWMDPCDVAALTDAPMLSSDVSRNANGDLLDYTNLFYHRNYMIEDPIETLLSGKTLIFNNGMV